MKLEARGCRGVLLAIAGMLAMASASAWAALPQQEEVRLALVGSGFFPQGKLALYRQVAAREGVQLDYQRTPLTPEARAALDGADLVLAEVPPVQAWRDEALPQQLQGLPRVLLIDRDGEQSQGLDKAQATLLAAYARNGGERNLTSLLHYLRQWKTEGRAPTDAPAALVMPRDGIYHPDYRDLAFASLDDYLRWLGPKVKPGQPVVGIAMFASAIGSDSTAHIDALVREVERRGGIALPFFRDTDKGVPVESLLMRDGKPFVDVVANFEILYRSDVGNDYARLGVPVLQAITYWDGPEAAWQADRQGIAPGMTSFYLALPEQAGFIDPMIVAAGKSRTPPQPIAAQVRSLANKALNYAKLRHLPAAEKRVAIVFYNYPPGEKNLGASGLNLPRSLHATLAAMREAGYGADLPTEDALLTTLQRLLSPSYRGIAEVDALLRDGLAGWLPLRDYKRWFDALPEATRAKIVSAWGEPDSSPWLRRRDGEAGFAIPRLQLRNVSLLPQPTRAVPGKDGAHDNSASYHDVTRPVDHFYLAAYQYLREQAGRDAIVHFGTHGTQEWSYGKERGLSVFDNPMLLVGDVPVVYPYIVDDVGEALQAKRRGRAVIVSHQTPAFGAAGLHGDGLQLHQLIDEYHVLDHGAVRDAAAKRLRELANQSGIAKDLQWDAARINADFDGFLGALHGYLDELGEQAQPQGLHSFGVSEDAARRGDTVRLMLGKRINATLGLGKQEPGDYNARADEPGRVWLQRHLIEGEPLPAAASAAQRDLLQAAQRSYASLDAAPEFAGLLDALAGRYSTPGLGGDPLRTPESLPTGRNLYGFDPLRVPSQAAWDAGQTALQQLIDSYRASHGGAYPDKLAFSLWGVETMRHNGILEAQVFAALGVRPVWDDGGRIEKVELIPASELGRPRIDVVLSATGLYRDQFGVLMQRMNEAVTLANADEAGDNPVARHTHAVRQRLLDQGLDAELADLYARTRIYSSEQGSYGSGLGGKVLETGKWDSDTELAESYLSRMQYGYGPDPKRWGEIPKGVNAYAEQLRGTQAAVLSRSSNLYGMLTTDDPFSYLGGLSLAVRHLDGQAPSLYISNLRDPASSKVEDAARFLAKELQTRQFHPGWIKQMQAEGYAGTLEVVSSMDNFWGWQVVDPGTVRADQWQEFNDVYVNDKLNLGTREWFERSNPDALAQIVERMLEADRKGYWQPDEATLRNLVQTWRQLQAQHDVLPGSDKLLPHIAKLASAFGLNAPRSAGRPAPAPSAAPPPPAPAAAADAPKLAPPKPANPRVTGMQLRQVLPTPPRSPLSLWLALLPSLLAFGIGGWRQSRA